MDVLLCSLFLISQVTVAAPTPSLTGAYCITSSISITVTLASTSLGLTTSGQQDVVLPPQLILRDTVRDSVGLTTVPQQQQYASPTLGSSQVSYLFQGQVFHQFITLYVGVCYGIYSCFQVPMWQPCLPMGTQSLGFAPLQPFILYPLEAYVPPCDCLWLM